MTCGETKCGRYDFKHSLSHSIEISHPWSYEVGSGRIWDYAKDSFIHKVRLNRCEGKARGREGSKVEVKGEGVREEFQGILESELERQRVWGLGEVERVERGLGEEIERR